MAVAKELADGSELAAAAANRLATAIDQPAAVIGQAAIGANRSAAVPDQTATGLDRTAAVHNRSPAASGHLPAGDNETPTDAVLSDAVSGASAALMNGPGAATDDSAVPFKQPEALTGRAPAVMTLTDALPAPPPASYPHGDRQTRCRRTRR